jgi:hypothetical protein
VFNFKKRSNNKSKELRTSTFRTKLKIVMRMKSMIVRRKRVKAMLKITLRRKLIFMLLKSFNKM